MKFLLATTDPQKLPITILSRCLQFHLKSLDQTQIAKQLEWVLDHEGSPSNHAPCWHWPKPPTAVCAMP